MLSSEAIEILFAVSFNKFKNPLLFVEGFLSLVPEPLEFVYCGLPIGIGDILHTKIDSGSVVDGVAPNIRLMNPDQNDGAVTLNKGGVTLEINNLHLGDNGRIYRI